MNVIKGRDEEGDYYKTSFGLKHYYKTPTQRLASLERAVGGELLGGMMKKKEKPVKVSKPKTRIKKTRATGQRCKVKSSAVTSAVEQPSSSLSSSSEEYM